MRHCEIALATLASSVASRSYALSLVMRALPILLTKYTTKFKGRLFIHASLTIKLIYLITSQGGSI